MTQALSGLKQRQTTAYLAILNGLVWILGILSLVIGIVAVVANLDITFMVLAGSIVMFTICAAVARRLVPQQRYLESLLLIGVPMFLIAVGAAFVFPNGSYLIAFAGIIMMLMSELILSARAIRVVGFIGLILFIPNVITGVLGGFDANYVRVGELGAYIVPIISIAALCIIALLAFTRTNVMLEAVNDAEQRGQLAEQSQADQAAMLVQVQQQAADQARLLELVHELEVPVIPLFEGVLALPVVGHLDPQRMAALTSALLEQVAHQRAHTVIVDLTGVAIIDTAVANGLLNLAQAVRLLGAAVMITGIKAEVAQSLVALGVSFDEITTAASLQDGIARVSERLQELAAQDQAR